MKNLTKFLFFIAFVVALLNLGASYGAGKMLTAYEERVTLLEVQLGNCKEDIRRMCGGPKYRTLPSNKKETQL